MQATSHVETCLIHHLCWAAVAVVWLVAIGDPLTLVSPWESSPQVPSIAAGSEALFERRVPSKAGDSFGSAVQATLFHGEAKRAAGTEVTSVEPQDGRRLNIEETLEFINQMERVPLSASDRQDLTEILDQW